MATIKMEGVETYIEMLSKLGDATDEIIPRAIIKGRDVLASALKRANAVFSRYVRRTKPKKNNYGWFAQVQFKGKTKSGAPAALAANVYEYGRGGKRPQKARPWIRATIRGAEAEAQQAMADEYDKAVKEIAGN